MSDIIFNNIKHIGKEASGHKILTAFAREARKQGCTVKLISSDYRAPDPNEEGEYKHCFLTKYNEETGDIEYITQFIDKAHTRIDSSKEPYVDFTVYGEIKIPAENNACFIVRIPNGRVPWSKKIAPAINKLINSWDKNNKNAQWYVDGDTANFIGDMRLWDIKAGKILKYQWINDQLKEIKS